MPLEIPQTAPDIIEDVAVNATIQIKTRAFRCEIETPKTGFADYRIAFHKEKVNVINGVFDGSTPAGSTNRQFTDVAAELVTIFDAVQQKDVTISVAGCAAAIQNRFLIWSAMDTAAQPQE